MVSGLLGAVGVTMMVYAHVDKLVDLGLLTADELGPPRTLAARGRLAKAPLPAGWRRPRPWTAVEVSPWRRGYRGWLGQPRGELLLGEAPQPVAKPHATKQILVPIDPAHRDAKPLGHLLYGEVPAHRTLPETTSRRSRA